MARVIDVTKDESNYRIYGAPTGYLDDYFDEKRQRFINSASSASREFFTNTNSLRNKWHGAEAVRLGKQAVAKLSTELRMPDEIIALTTTLQLQTARSRMQHVIMSHPEVKKRAKRGTISNYGFDCTINDDYHDKFINDGVIKFNEEGSYEYTKVYFIEDCFEQTRYTHEEKLDIQRTYQTIEEALADDEDPTSIWG